MYLASESWSGSKFSLVSGSPGPCRGCSASCVWRVSRGLALNSRLYLVSPGRGRVSRGLAINIRLYLVSSGRVLAAVHHVSCE